MRHKVIMECKHEWAPGKWSRVWCENECRHFRPTVNPIPEDVDCPDICRHCRHASLTRLAFG